MGVKFDVSTVVGKRFGRLVLLKEVSKPNAKYVYARYVKFKCDCGTYKNINMRNVLCGLVQSCGCKRVESTIERFTTHGMSNHELYGTWKAMMGRCYDKNNKRYYCYGGRGIVVCKAWHNVKVFIDWAISHGWKSELTIDRIDNDGNYTPKNCRWATYKQQSNNKSTNIERFWYNGKYCNASDVEKLSGVCRNTFIARVRRGLSVKQAIALGRYSHSNLVRSK